MKKRWRGRMGVDGEGKKGEMRDSGWEGKMNATKRWDKRWNKGWKSEMRGRRDVKIVLEGRDDRVVEREAKPWTSDLASEWANERTSKLRVASCVARKRVSQLSLLKTIRRLVMNTALMNLDEHQGKQTREREEERKRVKVEKRREGNHERRDIKV